jgi:hypothetical protein
MRMDVCEVRWVGQIAVQEAREEDQLDFGR